MQREGVCSGPEIWGWQIAGKGRDHDKIYFERAVDRENVVVQQYRGDKLTCGARRRTVQKLARVT